MIKKVLISQMAPDSGKSPYFDIAEKYKLKLDFHPFNRVEGLSSKEFRQQRINILDFTSIVFTSKTAIDHFFSICEEMKVLIPDTMLYFCVSESVALYLQKYTVYRKRKIHFGATGKIESLDAFFDKYNKETFLIPVSEVHAPNLTNILDDKKLSYQKTVMYRTVNNDISSDKIMSYDLLVFFTPASITSLFENVPDFQQASKYIACFGATTAKAIKDAGLTVDCEAPRPEYPSMTAALEEFIKTNHKENKLEKTEKI